MCLTYDGFKTISNSVKYLITKGEDYEDHEILIKTMRNQKFTGCTGEVYFIKSENSRNKPWLALLQLEINSTTGQFDFYLLAKFNKFAVIATEVIKKPIWASGEDSVPSNYRIPDLCLYKNTYPSIKSMLGLYIFSSVLLLIEILSSYTSLKKFDTEITEIPENVNLTNHDVFHYIFIICQFFQFLALEPSRGMISRTTNKLNLKLGLDFIHGAGLEMENYWKFYSILLWVVGIYVILIAIFVVSDKICFRIINNCTLIKIFIEYLLPAVGHFGFMPLVLMILSIFKCETEYDDNKYEIVFGYDCSLFCYKEKHLLYIITGSI